MTKNKIKANKKFEIFFFLIFKIKYEAKFKNKKILTNKMNL